MAWTTTHDIGVFRSRTEDFLLRRRARNTLLLTVSTSLTHGGADLFGDQPPVAGWWAPDGGEGGADPVAGAFLRTPPHPVVLSPMPEAAIEALPRTLAALPGAPLTGVNAEAAVAERFAAAWRRLTGVAFTEAVRQRLYRLGALAAPVPAPPGRARVATGRDRELLVRWYEAFAREVGARGGGVARLVDQRLTHGGLSLWEVDREPVALAGATRVIAGMARVAPVYTPPARRGRGYGAAATVTASRAALAAGAEELLLFTDLANPTSNGLYQRLGYRPVEDQLVLSVTPP